MERISNNDLPDGLMRVMIQVQNYVNGNGLDRTLIELINLRVSQMNGCAYCLDMHSKEAAHRGETLQRIATLSAWRDAPYYTDKEKVVLRFAEMLTQLSEHGNVDEMHAELLRHFSKAEIAHLTLAIAQINSWNRIVKSTGIEPGSYQVGSH